jgi:short-subunit dehydrogenase
MAGAFADQVAVITGASSGLGLALSQTLAAEGCKVGLIARRRDLLETAVQDLVSQGSTAAFAAADVAERSQILTAVEDLRRQLGPIDLMIANAGVSAPTRVQAFDTVHVEMLMRVNVLGMAYCFEAVLPEMLQRRQGHLAAVSSLAAYNGLPTHAAYSSSKAAINVFLDGLRRGLYGSGVAVTTICPGFIRTAMTAEHKFRMPWLLGPDEAARRIVRALRRKVKVYDFPWPTAVLMKLMARLPDWLVVRLVNRFMGAPAAEG